MQIRIFTIPILGGEKIADEMNVFLRTKKVLQVKEELITGGQEGSFWCFCIRYIDDIEAAEREREKTKVDYRKVLDAEAFQRFSVFRTIRKKVAQDDVVPPYAVFTDHELAELAKIPELTAGNMKKIKGIGEKKVEKYGHFFIEKKEDEASR